MFIIDLSDRLLAVFACGFGEFYRAPRRGLFNRAGGSWFAPLPDLRWCMR